MTRLVDALADEQVTAFVEDVASNLARYGLEFPSLQIVFSSFATENTAESKAGDHPFLTISFGKIEGETVYARVGDEPFVLAVRRSLIERIFTDPVQWQSLVIYNFKPEQVHRLTIKSDKEQTFVRDANKAWKAESGTTPVDPAKIQSVLTTLANLHASHWVGATTAQHGFDKPTLVATFTTSEDDKVSQKLTVGAASGDGTWFARVDGRDGTFAMSAGDVNMLKQSLTQTATPAPGGVASPAAGASAAHSTPGTPTATPKP